MYLIGVFSYHDTEMVRRSRDKQQFLVSVVTRIEEDLFGDIRTECRSIVVVNNRLSDFKSRSSRE